MHVRMSVLLMAYAVIVCAAMVCNTVVFSVRTSKTARAGAEKLSLISLTRSVTQIGNSLSSLQTSSARLSSSLFYGDAFAKPYGMNESITNLNKTFRLLRPPSAAGSLISQEEVWWSGSTSGWIDVGCFREMAVCFRGNGSMTTFVDVLGDTAYCEDASPLPPYFNLHVQMLELERSATSGASWSPEVVRYTPRTTALKCSNHSVEFVMAYYDCLEYELFTELPHAESANASATFCSHAVVTVFELLYRIQVGTGGLSNSSTQVIDSAYIIDEVNNTSCTDLPANSRAAVDSYLAGNPEVTTATEGLWQSVDFGSVNVSTTMVLKTVTGVFLVFNDLTPKSFFFSAFDRDRNTAIIITSVIVFVVVVASFLIWLRLALPLQRLCTGMKKTALGLIEDDAATAAATEKKASGAMFVREVFDLFTAYNGLRQALGELKAFAPQGLMVAQNCNTDTVPVFSDSASSMEMMVSSMARCPVIRPEQVLVEPRELDTADTPITVPPTTISARELPLPEVCHIDPAVSTSVDPSLPIGAYSTRDGLVSLLPLLHLGPDPNGLLDVSGNAASLGGTMTSVRTAHQLCLPVLQRTTAFRMVNCSTLLISYRLVTANLDDSVAEVQQFLDPCIELILASGGTVEVFRPDLIIASFGAQREDALHTKRALQCAVRLFSRFTDAQVQRVALFVDAGQYYVGTCGAHDRYARVLYGDRVNFALRLTRYDLGRGRILTSDSIAQSWQTKKYTFLPIDNIVPRGGIGTQTSSVLLFQLFPTAHLSTSKMETVRSYYDVFSAALSGKYEAALNQLVAAPVLDVTLRSSLEQALQTLLHTTPRRPRYCRIELPPYEALGTVLPTHYRAKLYKPLFVTEIERVVPQVNFLLGDDTPAEEQLCRTAGSALEAGRRGLDSAGAGAGHCGGGSGGGSEGGSGAVAGCDGARGNSETRTWACTASVQLAASFLAEAEGTDADNDGSDVPRHFRDSKGESWTLIPARLGSGAFADVYKAISANGVMVAVKCIHLARSNVNPIDVVREVNMSCKLWSEYIVNCTSWAHVGSQLLIVMELMSGGSLYDTVRHFPRGLLEPIAKHYASDALRGLAYLHRSGIVHADLKPQNMLLSADGACRLSDFGSSVTKATGALRASGDVFQLRGTPLYMSPEVARGEPPTMMSDVWSFGVTLHEMLTGQLPWVWADTGRPVYADSAVSSPASPPAAAAASSAAAAAAADMSSSLSAVAAAAAPGVMGCTPQSVFPGLRETNSIISPMPEFALSVGPIVTGPSTASRSPRDGRGLTVASFLQGVIRSEIVARPQTQLMPSVTGGMVVEACLRLDPAARATVEDLLYMQYFYM